MNSHSGASPTAGGADTNTVMAWTAIGIGVALQLVVGVPFTVASGLLAPIWAVVLLYALWIVGAVLVVKVARTRPLATPLVPAVNAGLLWLSITAGERLLGWTA